VDQSTRLVDAWRVAFSHMPSVSVFEGDYLEKPSDALVSPANSFGIMDGGIDLAIREHLGYGIENTMQSVVLSKYHGEMPVGCADVVETGSKSHPFLVVAPTMRIPERVARSLNAYHAFRAILLACEHFKMRRIVRANRRQKRTKKCQNTVKKSTNGLHSDVSANRADAATIAISQSLETDSVALKRLPKRHRPMSVNRCRRLLSVPQP
jgi:hypothetical protein